MLACPPEAAPPRTEADVLEAGSVRVRLGAVTAINSCGVREWIQTIMGITEACALEYEDVSKPMIRQFSDVANVRGKGVVRSFMAPYFCEACDKEVQKKLVLTDEQEWLGNAEALRPPPRNCPECGAEMEFDEIPEDYLHFVKLQLKG